MIISRPGSYLPPTPPRPSSWPTDSEGPLDSYLAAVEPAYMLAQLGKPPASAQSH